MGVENTGQRPTAQGLGKQANGVVGMGDVAGVDDGRRVVAGEHDLVGRQPAALQHLQTHGPVTLGMDCGGGHGGLGVHGHTSSFIPAWRAA